MKDLKEFTRKKRSASASETSRASSSGGRPLRAPKAWYTLEAIELKKRRDEKSRKGCCKVQACFTCRESEAQCCDQAWRFIRWGKARRDQQAGSKIGYHWSSYQPGDLCGDRAVEGDIPWGAIFWLGHQSGKGQDIAASGSSREVREGDGWMAQGGGKVQSKSGSKVMVLQISIVEQPCWVTFEPSVAPFLVDVTTKVEDL